MSDTFFPLQPQAERKCQTPYGTLEGAARGEQGSGDEDTADQGRGEDRHLERRLDACDRATLPYHLPSATW